MGTINSDTDPDTVTILHRRGPTQKTLRTAAVGLNIFASMLETLPIVEYLNCSYDNLRARMELNAAQRRGIAIETSKKLMAGGNRQHHAAKNTARLDEETEELHHERVSLTLGKVMQQARQTKEWTQKDLATHINEKPQVVAEYENGKAVPNQQILAKMERALGVKLRGKDMGHPLVSKGASAVIKKK
uniref:HTH cro/C1-type domain-containing protein n=1 Tax=Setaria digitata TaxID=48799 RepID=A0A915PT36_9BILA